MRGCTVGKLVVVERSFDPSYKIGGARWLCRCQCGAEVVVKGSQLRAWKTHGHVASCKQCRVPRRGPRTYKLRRRKPSKYCKLCCGQSFRVEGETCKCGRRYEPEKLPRAHELAQHKYDRVP